MFRNYDILSAGKHLFPELNLSAFMLKLNYIALRIYENTDKKASLFNAAGYIASLLGYAHLQIPQGKSPTN